MPAPSPRRPAALALLAGLLLAGCGSVGSAGSATPAAPSADITVPDAGGSGGSDGSGTGGGEGEATAAAATLPDPCSLLTEAEIGTALEAAEPMYLAANTTTTVDPAVPSGHGTSCEYLWSVKDSAQGTFTVEVQPAADWDFIVIDDDPRPVDGVANADQAVEIGQQAWARMNGGYAIGVLGANGADFRGGLLIAAANDAP